MTIIESVYGVLYLVFLMFNILFYCVWVLHVFGSPSKEDIREIIREELKKHISCE